VEKAMEEEVMEEEVMEEEVMEEEEDKKLEEKEAEEGGTPSYRTRAYLRLASPLFVFHTSIYSRFSVSFTSSVGFRTMGWAVSDLQRCPLHGGPVYGKSSCRREKM
jgi:hypothetical protein